MLHQTACFTGSRNLPPDEREEVFGRVVALLHRLYGEGYRYFGVGGALGFDELAARAVLSLRGTYPAIRLIGVLPCRDWDAKWPRGDRERYAALLAGMDKVVVLCEGYEPGCLQRRNRWLVDNSSLCIGWGEDTGGTAYTLAYAEKQGKRVIRLER